MPELELVQALMNMHPWLKAVISAVLVGLFIASLWWRVTRARRSWRIKRFEIARDLDKSVKDTKLDLDPLLVEIAFSALYGHDAPHKVIQQLWVTGCPERAVQRYLRARPYLKPADKTDRPQGRSAVQSRFWWIVPVSLVAAYLLLAGIGLALLFRLFEKPSRSLAPVFVWDGGLLWFVLVALTEARNFWSARKLHEEFSQGMKRRGN